MNSDVIVFPLTLRSPPAGQAERSAAAVVPFPYSRRRHLVERHARAMRGMSQDESEAYLTEVLERVCAELGRIGVDCEANDMIFDLADAIGKQLHGPHFTLKIDGAAK